MATTKESAARWALMIGINYYPKDRHLYGSVSDVHDIKTYLEQHSTTPVRTSVLTATVPESSNDPPEPFENRPTRANVLVQLRKIIDSAKSGDHVYIHFSGHGTQLPSDGRVGETGFGELGLVLFENGEHGASYFRGRFLAQALRRMVDKGLVVTVVLDCCFSGAVSRGDHGPGFRIRTMEYDPTLDADRSQQDQECKLALGSSGRNARLDRDWLVDPQGYTIITACGPHEKALEVLVNKKQKRGALTYYLFKALTTLSKLQDNVSHQSLHEMVVSMMQSSGCGQTPMRYGNTRLSFFGSLLDPESLNALPVYMKGDSTLFIKAGQVHGISVGDEFTVYRVLSPGTNLPTGDSDAKESFKVKSVWAFESELKTSQDSRTMSSQFSHRMKDLGILKATQLSRISSQRIKVWLPPGLIRAKKWEDKANLFQYLQIVTDSEEQSLCMFQLTTNKSNEYEIVGEAQENMLELPILDVDSEDSFPTMMGILHHLATFKYFEGLDNRLPSPEFRATYTINPTVDSTRNGIFKVLDGGIFEFIIENHADQPSYAAIFGFDPSWGVKNLVAQSGGDDYVLVPPADGQNSGSKQIKLRMTIPTHYQPRTQDDQVRDVIKVFITNKPISFPGLVLPGLRMNSSHPRDLVANAKIISDFIKLLDTGGRMRTDRDTGAWMSHNFIVRTSIS
ncbi:Metacaspase-1A [Fusarium albosuccineum]|uniref:Metacaspase-1A n=1 Tax=Fusarium albosuccineum TaxID=1237068 RepID=A0A8H4NZZ2_9HYPO|nr:Metacaspase-1A [Fusarium albosuccineum]